MTLHDQATAYNAMIIQDAMDQYGLIRHKLTYPERKAIPYADLEHVRQDTAERKATGKKWHPLAGTPAYAMYEDASYVGNRYLVAAVWRWLAAPTPEAQADARKAYQATIYPYREGRKREPGYWPKPYGALVGENRVESSYTETSVDQAYSPVIALWRYYQHLASDAEQQEIGQALQEHGHWWIRHDYTYDYLGEIWRVFGDRITSPSGALKIPIGMHIAYQVTGDTALRDECVRILRKGIADGGLKMHRGPRGETKELYHWAEMYDYFLRETDLAQEADWPRLIQECWHAARSTIQPDGLCIGMGDFQADGTVQRYTPGFIDDVHHGYWQTDARHPASTAQMAALAMLVHELGYDAEAGATGARLLEQITPDRLGDMRGYLFTDTAQMPPDYRESPPKKLFNVRTTVFWLDAYWRGKLHGVL